MSQHLDSLVTDFEGRSEADATSSVSKITMLQIRFNQIPPDKVFRREKILDKASRLVLALSEDSPEAKKLKEELMQTTYHSIQKVKARRASLEVKRANMQAEIEKIDRLLNGPSPQS